MSEKDLLKSLSDEKLRRIIRGCRGDGNIETKKIAEDILWERKAGRLGQTINSLKGPLAWQI